MCVTRQKIGIFIIAYVTGNGLFSNYSTAYATSQTTLGHAVNQVYDVRAVHQHTSEPKDGVVNINEATAEQLQLLPRIGPATAQRVLKMRAKRVFRRPIELLRVRGIGRKTYRMLKPYVTVNGKTTLKKKVHVRR